MVNLTYLTPEKCYSCCKPVRSGHPFLICQNCDRILHKKCKSTDNIKIFRESTYCVSCIEKNDIIRYNPFYQPPHFSGNNNPINEEPIDYIESLQTISNILENCRSYSIHQLNSQESIARSEGNYLSTLFLNIDGNSTNFDNFVIQTSALSHKFSVIGLAETNTDPENGCLYQIGEYSSCYQSRFINESETMYKPKGSGVCLYIHDQFNFSKDNSLSLCKESIESLFVTITNTPEPLKIGVVYRPPNASLDEFNKEYEHILSELNGKKAYILGDFNVNLISTTSPPQERLQEIIYSHGFTPTISIPTHQMPNCARTCIDNVHSNDIDNSVISGVIMDKISHHHPVFFMKKLSVVGSESHPEKITIHYNFSNANLEKLCEDIENDIDTFLNGCDSFDSFLSLYQEKIDASCKLLTPRTTKRNSITNPWITQGLINSIEKKARLYFDWRDSCTTENPEGNSRKLSLYKEYKQFLKNAIKRAKSTHYANQFDKHICSSKKTWEVINELRGKCKPCPKDDFVIDGTRITCRRVIANKFNEYFTSLASNLNEKVLSDNNIAISSPLESFSHFLSRSSPCSIFLNDTDSDEVKEIIMDFKNGKASDIPIVVVKKTAHLISTPLAKLYNQCMRSGTFPSVFKTGKVTPIYKKDNKECIENYRPVSILPIFGKIFEKIIYNRLYAFFTSKGILHDDQFGFRKGHSTSHALHKSVDSITKSLANGRHVLGIFIDLSKAFDTLDHNILLNKLEHYGIRGSALSLMSSYLSNRKQYVCFNNMSSDTLSIRYGVPQGSILGPLLFLLYMNDIMNSFTDCDTRFVLYADDTNIFITGPSKESTYLKANSVLNHISKFMKCNLLHINMSKCCYIHFQPISDSDETCARVRPYATENDTSRAIFINGVKISKVSSTKFLGVVIDEKLNWGPHIEYLRKKLRSITGALCRIRKSVPADLYLKIYNALFESHLSYGISVWGASVKDKANDKLFIIQKHCIRILFGDLDAYLEKQSTCARARPYKQQKLGARYFEKEHTKPIFNRLNILTVQALYKYHCISEIFKIIRFRCPYSLYECINISKRDTSNVILLPNKSNTFLYLASYMWNSVHKRIISPEKGICTPLNSIKLRMKNILLGAQSSEMKNVWTDHNFQIPLPTTSTSLKVHRPIGENEIVIV